MGTRIEIYTPEHNKEVIDDMIAKIKEALGVNDYATYTVHALQ